MSFHGSRLVGPILLVAGGFYGGKAVIVEPLCNPLWMLTGAKRENALAQVLHTLRQGVRNVEEWVNFILSNSMALKVLCRSLSQPVMSFPPGVPRLYPTCRILDNNTEAQITFQSVFRASYDKPIFNANLHGFKGQVLAKMTSRPYGAFVHRFLGNCNLAPRLIGVCTLDEQCPTIYVMEKLDDSWTSLAAWSKEEAPVGSEQRSTIRARVHDSIIEIIGLLEGENLVHGDLRTTNLMIKRDGSALKVIDFDWAGEAGKILYPFERNEDVGEWPVGSEPGGIISKADDHALFEKWWAGFLN